MILMSSRLDVYADDRPWASHQVQNGEITIRFAAPTKRLRFEGHQNSELVASLNVDVD